MYSRVILAALAAISAPAVAPPAAKPTMGLDLVPMPARVQRLTGSFTLTPRTRIIVDRSAEEERTGSLLAEHLRASTGYALPVRPLGRAGNGDIVLTVKGADPALGKEGYTLDVTRRGIVVRAPHPAGLYYGSQTLRQMFPPKVESPTKVSSVEWTAPAAHIWDKPRFPVRGFMLDSSRHIQTIGFIKRTIDRMSYHKLNLFHWHLTDDNGWRLEIKRYPKLTQIGAWRTEPDGKRYGGFFTQDQVRDIIRYAAARYVTIVPEIEMPGHSAAELASYPEVACYPGDFKVTKIGEGVQNVICPGKESTYRFEENILDEVMALFPSKVIHIGGDEVNKQWWQKCPDCQRTIQANHLADEKALQSYYIHRIAAYLRAHGHRLQGWNEIMEGGKLSPEIILHQWNSPEAGAAAARAGNDVINSLTSYCYFDYDYNTTPLRKVYSMEPVPDGLTPAQQKHILGAQANLWTEWRVDDRACDDFTWPRLVALAEVDWSPKSARDWDSFVERMRDAHYERLALMGLGTPGAPPPDLREQLIAHSDFDMGLTVGRWRPRQMSEQPKTLDWDITRFVTRPGTYRITPRYEKGADGIKIDWVAILRDGVEAGRDTHDGFAGGASHDNNYRITLDRTPPSSKYTVRIQLHSDGGTDSAGSVWLLPPQ